MTETDITEFVKGRSTETKRSRGVAVGEFMTSGSIFAQGVMICFSDLGARNIMKSAGSRNGAIVSGEKSATNSGNCELCSDFGMLLPGIYIQETLGCNERKSGSETEIDTTKRKVLLRNRVKELDSNTGLRGWSLGNYS